MRDVYNTAIVYAIRYYYYYYVRGMRLFFFPRTAISFLSLTYEPGRIVIVVVGPPQKDKTHRGPLMLIRDDF